jgi:hypothetical protein
MGVYDVLHFGHRRIRYFPLRTRYSLVPAGRRQRHLQTGAPHDFIRDHICVDENFAGAFTAALGRELKAIGGRLMGQH